MGVMHGSRYNGFVQRTVPCAYIMTHTLALAASLPSLQAQYFFHASVQFVNSLSSRSKLCVTTSTLDHGRAAQRSH
jgi:hypothetical protein